MATHRPLAGSPVIDAGNPAAVPGIGGVPAFDQRGFGFSRVVDGGGVITTPRIDIGAYELQPTLLLVDRGGALNLDVNDGNFNVGQLTLREAIFLANQNPVPDIIAFAPTLPPVIEINSGMVITGPLAINGPGSGALTVRAAGDDDNPLTPPITILTIDDGTANLIDVSISGIELFNGAAGQLRSRENVTITDINFVSNRNAAAAGGGYYLP